MSPSVDSAWDIMDIMNNVKVWSYCLCCVKLVYSTCIKYIINDKRIATAQVFLYEYCNSILKHDLYSNKIFNV